MSRTFLKIPAYFKRRKSGIFRTAQKGLFANAPDRYRKTAHIIGIEGNPAAGIIPALRRSEIIYTKVLTFAVVKIICLFTFTLSALRGIETDFLVIEIFSLKGGLYV